MEKQARPQAVINNAFYDTLNDEWYTAKDHPIGLLRAENKTRAPWVAEVIKKRLEKPARVLDIGCGAGFLSNYLAVQGHEVTGIDISQNSLEIARKHDSSKQVRYLEANAYTLPFENESFDVACAMDILEHVEKPEQLIYEASRVLRPGGLFFFHTFNRNPLSRLIVIKGVDWFVKNAPKDMHVYNLFITPDELSMKCREAGMIVDTLRGFEPRLNLAFWKMLFTREVPDGFSFKFTKNLWTGYCGVALKQS